MNFKPLYQKPIQAIAWITRKTKETIKAISSWSISKTVAFVKGNWNLIVTIAKWVAERIQALGRFWIGIALMSVGAKMVSINMQAIMQFFKGQITSGDFTFGIFLVVIGAICVVYSADYSKFRLWGNG